MEIMVSPPPPTHLCHTSLSDAPAGVEGEASTEARPPDATPPGNKRAWGDQATPERKCPPAAGDALIISAHITETLR